MEDVGRSEVAVEGRVAVGERPVVGVEGSHQEAGVDTREGMTPGLLPRLSRLEK